MFLLYQRHMEFHKWLLYVLLHNCAIFIDSYSPINKFYSFIIFSVLINVVILLLNCLVLILYLYIHFLSLRSYFIYLNIVAMDLYITDAALKVSRYLYCFTTSLSHGVEAVGYAPPMCSKAYYSWICGYYGLIISAFTRIIIFYPAVWCTMLHSVSCS